METRCSNRWKCLPGGFDALNTALIESEDDFPVLSSQNLPTSFKTVVCNNYKAYSSDCIVSMFVDDYILERFWNNPKKYIEKFRGVAAVMSPDYSMLIGMPKPVLQFNVYRNRLIGSVWQNHGINVIPTISWTDENSFGFCFEGIKRGSIVSVSNTGCKTEYQKKIFDEGFAAMKKVIQPQIILFQCHKSKRHLYEDKNILFLDSFFEQKRKTWEEEAGKN